SKGRSRHISWLGIWVRREWWGRGIGTALMQKAIAVASDYGCKRLMLGVFSGNERALNLYRKIGFHVDLELTDMVLVDGKWRNSIIMGLDLSDLQPRRSPSKGSMDERIEVDKLRVRQLMDDDLDELNRLQNCPESEMCFYLLKHGN
ncbi:MAG TPA: GNAT family N-acetyltransferase, partial [Candidatus Bathyarchaeota archaeon]|nr:GNAT family N-acetyltransferase [Candidatus Bathyarchaeota archaeon]HEX69451.1 GNAT family N-acetyltransferase [Candidatus Bathyarchaeota archaeon]